MNSRHKPSQKINSKWITDLNAKYKKLLKLSKKTKTQRPNEQNTLTNTSLKEYIQDFPGGAVVKNLPANAGDTGSSPGL